MKDQMEISGGGEWKAVCLTCKVILGYTDSQYEARQIALAHTEKPGNRYHEIDVTHRQS